MKFARIATVAFLLTAIFGLAENSITEQLKELEVQIEKTPDNPMLLYRKAQYLMKLEKREEGYQTAKDAMVLFIKKNDDLSWMILEKIDLGDLRIDVHFNMGPRERKPPEIGIIRPLYFRIWKKGKDEQDIGELLEIIDFEIAFFNGKPSTAALGQMSGQSHFNFGILDTTSTYTQIRERLIALVKGHHKNPKKS